MRPIRQMNVTANAMAGGNFTAKAEEEGTDELVQRGRSLNHLSAALSATISDLTLEKNRLHAVINGIGEGIIAIDAEGKIIKTNSAALRLLGGAGLQCVVRCDFDTVNTGSFQHAIIEVNFTCSHECFKICKGTLKVG